MGSLSVTDTTMSIFRRTSWRALMARASQWLGRASYLQKWLVLGVLIGTIAGLGAIVFYETLLACTHLFLGVLAGYHVPTPTGEGGHAASASFSRPWALPLVVGLGVFARGALGRPIRTGGRGPRNRCCHPCGAPQSTGYQIQGGARQDRRFSADHRIGRFRAGADLSGGVLFRCTRRSVCSPGPGGTEARRRVGVPLNTN